MSEFNLHRRSAFALLSDTVIYGIGNLTTSGIAFLLLPVFTKRLDASEFGMYGVCMSLGGILGCIAVLGIDSGFPIHFADAKDSEERRMAVSTAARVVFVSMGIVIAITGLLYAQIKGFLGVPLWVFVVAVVAGVTSGGKSFLLGILRWQFRVKLFVGVGIVSSVLYAGSCIVALYYFRFGWSSILVVMVCTNLLSCVALSGVNREVWSGHFDPSLSLSMFKVGAPFMIANLGTLLLNHTGRIMLAAFDGFRASGAYTVAYQLSQVPQLAFLAMAMAFGPFQLARYKESGAPELFARITLLIGLGTVGIALGVALFSREIAGLLVLGRNYGPVAPIMILLVLAAVLNGMQWFVAFGLIVARKTYHQIWIQAVAVMIAMLLNIVLIPSWGLGWGLTGAAVATIISQGVVLGLTVFMGQRYYKIPYKFGGFAIAVFIAVGSVIFVTWAARVTTLPQLWGIRLGVLMGYSSLVMWLGRVRISDLLSIRKLVEAHSTRMAS